MIQVLQVGTVPFVAFHLKCLGKRTQPPAPQRNLQEISTSKAAECSQKVQCRKRMLYDSTLQLCVCEMSSGWPVSLTPDCPAQDSTADLILMRSPWRCVGTWICIYLDRGVWGWVGLKIAFKLERQEGKNAVCDYYPSRKSFSRTCLKVWSVKISL